MACSVKTMFGGSGEGLELTTFYQRSTTPYPASSSGGIAPSASVVFRDELHTLGNSTLHYKFNRSEWTTVSTLPYSISGECVGRTVVCDDEIHVFGNANYPRDHYMWNGTAWTQLRGITLTPNVGSYHIAVAKINTGVERIFIVDRFNVQIYDNGNYATVCTFDTVPFERIYSICSIDSTIFITTTTGSASTSTYNSVYYLDVSDASPTWTFAGYGGYDSTQNTLCAFNGAVHSLGGYYNNAALSTHTKYQSGTSWVKENPLPIRTSVMSCVEYDNNINIVGCRGTNLENNAHYVLDGTIYIK